MNIFEYEDYKDILKFNIRSKGKARHGLYRKIAEHLNVHPTLVSQVISGDKHFSEEQLFSVCEFLGISKFETIYLLSLLQIERAGSKKLKDHYTEVKKKLRKQSLQISQRVEEVRVLNEEEKAIFYSNWIYSAVHLMTTLDKEICFEDICKRFVLPTGKAREILDFLSQIRMISEENGKFKIGTVSTHLEKNSPFLLKHHTSWRLKAIQAAENLSDEELIYSVNVSLSRSDFARLREDLVQFIQHFLAVVKDSPSEDIAQLNLDLFWIK